VIRLLLVGVYVAGLFLSGRRFMFDDFKELDEDNLSANVGGLMPGTGVKCGWAGPTFCDDAGESYVVFYCNRMFDHPGCHAATMLWDEGHAGVPMVEPIDAGA
jgi:hypothetical protein